MAFTLDITDAADGTGFTYTTDGLVAPFATGTTLWLWQDGGLGGVADVIVADTALGHVTDKAISVAEGYYLGLVRGVRAGNPDVFSNAFRFAVTDADNQAVAYTIWQAVVAKLKSLGLADVVDASVELRKFPMDRLLGSDGLAFPCILVTPVREQYLDGGVMSKDDVGHGVQVTVVCKDDFQLKTKLPEIALYRQQIVRAFIRQRLLGAGDVYNCRIEPADVFIPQAWSGGLAATSVILRFITREPRGI